jgi:hypothetical protein
MVLAVFEEEEDQFEFEVAVLYRLAFSVGLQFAGPVFGLMGFDLNRVDLGQGDIHIFGDRLQLVNCEVRVGLVLLYPFANGVAENQVGEFVCLFDAILECDSLPTADVDPLFQHHIPRPSLQASSTLNISSLLFFISLR